MIEQNLSAASRTNPPGRQMTEQSCGIKLALCLSGPRPAPQGSDRLLACAGLGNCVAHQPNRRFPRSFGRSEIFVQGTSSCMRGGRGRETYRRRNVHFRILREHYLATFGATHLSGFQSYHAESPGKEDAAKIVHELLCRGMMLNVLLYTTLQDHCPV